MWSVISGEVGTFTKEVPNINSNHHQQNGYNLQLTNRLTAKVNKAADAAGEVVRKYYSNAARFQFREKDGDGPVTCAGVEAEQAIVSVILDAFPSHSIYGEETGWHNKDNACFLDQFVWVLDPIDGTSSFVGKDNCAFGILIGLVYNGKPIIGCIDQPVLKLRWVGVEGKGTTINGQRVDSTVDCCDLGKAQVHLKVPSYNDLAKKVGRRLFNGNWLRVLLMLSLIVLSILMISSLLFRCCY
ncbi:hypothetical protein CQW23_19981 [Capsicum baccatum]|uniref:Bifunctional phosphatase IMPL2, chloroplastic n=1 Tax=Capsicum baccatum TaxID=33114 RepID=A0A2G2W7E3_CAPBA|nr:hypothetical protein CQW23_19981 [Capsicum baccatum]